MVLVKVVVLMMQYILHTYRCYSLVKSVHGIYSYFRPVSSPPLPPNQQIIINNYSLVTNKILFSFTSAFDLEYPCNCNFFKNRKNYCFVVYKHFYASKKYFLFY